MWFVVLGGVHQWFYDSECIDVYWCRWVVCRVDLNCMNWDVVDLVSHCEVSGGGGTCVS